MNESLECQIYPWHQQVWQQLTARPDNLGHALLLYGRDGCGALSFANQLAMWVLCHARESHMACGHCASCLWFNSKTHPNFVHITLTDEELKKNNAKIKIEKIRELLPFVQQTGEGWRVVLIEPAQALNMASSNALLKTLEEPGARILIILLAEHFTQLPATISSRVQRFALDRIDQAQALNYLKQHLSGQTAEHYQMLLNLSNQMPLQALLTHNQDWVTQRASFLQDWQQLVEQKHMPLTLSVKWQKILATESLLKLLEYLLCDLICVKLNQKVKNIDLKFTTLLPHYNLSTLYALLDTLQQSKKLLGQNVQSQLVIDQLFIQLMHV